MAMHLAFSMNSGVDLPACSLPGLDRVTIKLGRQRQADSPPSLKVGYLLF